MDRREQMRKWLARRERLGLTLRELSLETGVPIGTLGHWSWRLRKEEKAPRARAPRPSSFVELVTDSTSSPSVSASQIEVVLANGRRLVFSDGIDEAHLRRVVRALERC